MAVATCHDPSELCGQMWYIYYASLLGKVTPVSIVFSQVCILQSGEEGGGGDGRFTVADVWRCRGEPRTCS